MNLSNDTAKTIINAYITSRLDYFIALYYGLLKYLIDRLIRIDQLRRESNDHVYTCSLCAI